MDGVISGEEDLEEEEEEEVHTQDLLCHIAGIRIPIYSLLCQRKAGDQVSGLARWVVVRLVMSLGGEARGMSRHLLGDGRLQDFRALMILVKEVQVRRLGSQLLRQVLGLVLPGGGNSRKRLNQGVYAVISVIQPHGLVEIT